MDKYIEKKLPITAARLKELRKEKGETSAQVAINAGVDKDILRKYECGYYKLNNDCRNLRKLADYYNVLPEYILGAEYRTKIEKAIAAKININTALGIDPSYKADVTSIREMADHVYKQSLKMQINNNISHLYLSDFDYKPISECTDSDWDTTFEVLEEYLNGDKHTGSVMVEYFNMMNDIQEYIEKRTQQFKDLIKQNI